MEVVDGFVEDGLRLARRVVYGRALALQAAEVRRALAELREEVKDERAAGRYALRRVLLHGIEVETRLDGHAAAHARVLLLAQLAQAREAEVAQVERVRVDEAGRAAQVHALQKDVALQRAHKVRCKHAHERARREKHHALQHKRLSLREDRAPLCAAHRLRHARPK